MIDKSKVGNLKEAYVKFTKTGELAESGLLVFVNDYSRLINDTVSPMSAMEVPLILVALSTMQTALIARFPEEKIIADFISSKVNLVASIMKSKEAGK